MVTNINVASCLQAHNSVAFVTVTRTAVSQIQAFFEWKLQRAFQEAVSAKFVYGEMWLVLISVLAKI